MRNALVVGAVCFSLARGVTLVAHHSFAAEFDAHKVVRVTGALTKIEWTNPHSYFYVDGKDDAGVSGKWTCEAAAPGSLSRQGLRRGDVKIGDTIIIDGYRAKDGSNIVDAQRVTLPDGRIISGAGSPDAPAAAPESAPAR